MTIQLSEHLIRKAEIWALYANWDDLLQQQTQTDFLYSHKDAYFKGFFWDEKKQAQAQRILEHICSFGWSSEEIDKELTLATEKLKRKISFIEQALLNSASSLSSSAIRFFTHNPYALKADFLVDSQDRALQSAELGQFSAPLEPAYRKFSKILTTCGLLTLDFLQWRWLGFSQNMLTAISHQFMPRAEVWINLFGYLEKDEKAAMASLPIIGHLFDLATFIGINAYHYGLSLRSFTQISITYGLALATSYLCAKAVNGCYRAIYKNRPLQDIPTYPLVHGLAQWVAFPLTVTYALPFLFKYFSAPPENVLRDKETCLAHKDLCRKGCRKVLGLPENATIATVKETFRNLAIQYHPDKNSTGADTFRQISEAKEYCLLLEK